MKTLLLLIVVLMQFETAKAAENPVPESILDGLAEELLAGLDSVIFEGEYIIEGGLIPPSITEEIYKNIEIFSSDRKILVSRKKKRHTIRDSEPQELLRKTGLE